MVNLQRFGAILSLDRRQHWGQIARRLRRPALMGSLRRLQPLSKHWGFDRGTPVDRHYIEQFLEGHRSDIKGCVLEVLNNNYTVRFGSGVTKSDVLDIDAANPHATIVADLAAASNVPDNSFDCFILTQTLHLIYDLEATLSHIYRILRPDGVLLLTVPAISAISYPDGTHPDYWRFTPYACQRMFGDLFGERFITVQAYGNVLTGVAFLMGMAREELSSRELSYYDPTFPVITTVRAQKSRQTMDGAR